MEVEQMVILDAGQMNEAKVKIVELSPLSEFAKIRSEDGTEWIVMTKRLKNII